MTDATYCGVCHAYADHTGAPSAAMTVTYDDGQPAPDISMVTHPR